MPITVSNAAASVANPQPDGSGGSIEVTWTASSNVRTDYDITLLKNGVAVSNGHVTKYSPSAINNVYRFPGTGLRLGDGTYSARITPSGGSAVTTNGVQFTSAILGPPDKPVSGRNSTDQKPRTTSVAPAAEPFRPSDDVKPIFTVASLNDAQITNINKLSTKYGIDTSGVGRQVGPTGLFSDIDGPGGFPFGSVSPTSLSSQAVLSDNATTSTADLSRKKSGVGGRAEFWIRPVPEKASGKEGYGLGARIELMPARRSFTQNQGQMVPGVGAGLEIKTKTNLSRIPIPGARPIYQHMGIAEEIISFVGAFVGFDMPASQGGVSVVDSDTAPKRIGDSWDEAVNVVEQIRSGYELELVMRWNADTATGSGEDLSLDYMPGVRYRGFIRNFVKEFATQQRVYYRIEFVVTNRGTPNLNEKVDAPSLAPKAISSSNLFAKSAGSDESAVNTDQKLGQKTSTDATKDRVSVPIYVQEWDNGVITVNYQGKITNPGIDDLGHVVMPAPVDKYGTASLLTRITWGSHEKKAMVFWTNNVNGFEAKADLYDRDYTREEFIERYINSVYSRYGSSERYTPNMKTPPGPGTIRPSLTRTELPLDTDRNPFVKPSTAPKKPVAPKEGQLTADPASGLVSSGIRLFKGKSLYVPKFGTYNYGFSADSSKVVITGNSGPLASNIAYYEYTPSADKNGRLVVVYNQGSKDTFTGVTYDEFHKMFSPQSGKTK